MKRIIFPSLMLLFIAASMFTVSGCKKSEDTTPATPAAPASLYTRLGKVEAITLVVDKFLANVVADARINGDFAATVANPSRTQLLRNNLIDQICQGTGGPCVYKGKTMLEAHTGQNVTQADFNALVEDLVAALDHYNVPTQEKNELLAILGPMQSDIVGK